MQIKLFDKMLLADLSEIRFNKFKNDQTPSKEKLLQQALRFVGQTAIFKENHSLVRDTLRPVLNPASRKSAHSYHTEKAEKRKRKGERKMSANEYENENRTHVISVRVTKEEHDRIMRNFEKSGWRRVAADGTRTHLV